VDFEKGERDGVKNGKAINHANEQADVVNSKN
jgi:hypothetical protein